MISKTSFNSEFEAEVMQMNHLYQGPAATPKGGESYTRPH